MENIDINGWITIIAVLAYIAVFIIQNSQIKKQTEIVKTMESFMNIFKVDEVLKYNDMRDERIKEQASKIILKSEQVEKIKKEVFKQSEKPIKDFYNNLITERNNELINVSFITTMNQSKELRNKFVEEYLPLNKDIINAMIDSFEKNNES
tara:strand:+ start:112 stop:564 length:453 start_codon:yes stop_codon:yes gene_type:complete